MATLNVNGSTGNDSYTRAQLIANSSLAWATVSRAAWGSSSYGSPNTTECAQPGDTVLVAAGVYSTVRASPLDNGGRIPTLNPAKSGTSGNRIVFQAVGTVELRHTGLVGPVFGTNNRNYITWDGFTANAQYADTTMSNGVGIIEESDYVTIQNCNIIGRAWTGGGDSDNWVLIWVEDTTGSLIYNNRLHGCTWSGDGNTFAITTYNVNGTYPALEIKNNEIYDNTGGIYLKGNGNTNVALHHNKIYNAVSVGIKVHYISNSKIYQNVIYNTNGFEFSPGEAASSGNYIVNNTIDDSGWIGIYISSYTATGTFYNNLITYSKTVESEGGAVGSAGGSSPGSNTFEHNIYYQYGSCLWYDQGGGCRNFSYWQSTFGKDTVSPAGQVANPGYVDRTGGDFRLNSYISGPAINGGVDILDLDGDGQTDDLINCGAYITGNETIGYTTSGGSSESASQSPSKSPSKSPSASPSLSPSASQSPSGSPSVSPSKSPSKSPSISPSRSPSLSPSGSPSKSPSESPSQSPSASPSSGSEYPKFILATSPYMSSVATSRQMSVPGGKSTFTHYAAGLMTDDENPISSIDLGTSFGSEFITNGNVESDSNPPKYSWEDVNSPDTNERSSASAHGGTYSIHVVDSDPGSYAGVRNTYFTSTSERTYRISFWYNLVSGYMRLVWLRGLDGSGQNITSFGGAPTGWTYYECDYTETAGGTSASIAIINNRSGAGAENAAEFYIDDVSIREVYYKFTEIEWNVQATTEAVPGDTYEFRVTRRS